MEIELYNKLNDPLEAIEKIGGFFAKSGMFGCQRTEQGAVLAMACMAERKSPIEITRTYHMVDGKLSKKALAIAAEFRGKGGKIEWLNTGKDGKKAEARFTFEGQTLVESFTIEEAQKQGLIRSGSAWEKTPANMLRARVLSNAIAMLAPEIVAGVSGNPEDGDDVTADSEPAKTLLKKDPEPRQEPKPVKQESKPDPKPEPKPEPKQEPEIQEAELVLVKKAESGEEGKLSVATVQTLEHVIGEANAGQALAWLKAKGHIKTSLFDVPLPLAQKIIDGPEKFLKAIGGGK